MGKQQQTGMGKIVLVGAGPGDPGLITLRGVEMLRRADIVLYDFLANPLILSHATDAEQVCVGKHGTSRLWSQSEINDYLVREAKRGKNVVRLKGGDPSIFGRSAEEVERLAEEGIPFEIVPGVTAAAAGSYAGIPLTHRDASSAVAYVTGQESDDKTDSQLDYAALARFPGTLVIYMAVTSVERWTSELLNAGKSPATPAAIIRRCSCPDQRTIVCSLAEVADHLTPRSKFPPPVIVILGEVVRFRDALSWYDRLPLFGRTIMVTRPAHQQEGLYRPFAELGARVVRQPAIVIQQPSEWRAVDDCIDRLDHFDWLVFSSANGVRYFLDRLESLGHDLRLLGSIKLAAIGPATNQELGRYRLRSDVQPDQFQAEALAQCLSQEANGQRFLLIRASRGREVLAEQLQESAETVEQVVAYQSTDVAQPEPQVREMLAERAIDWITVTSSAIARSLVSMFGDQLNRSRLVSISPITSATLNQLGFAPAAEATTYTMTGLVEAVMLAECPGP